MRECPQNTLETTGPHLVKWSVPIAYKPARPFLCSSPGKLTHGPEEPRADMRSSAVRGGKQTEMTLMYYNRRSEKRVCAQWKENSSGVSTQQNPRRTQS